MLKTRNLFLLARNTNRFISTNKVIKQKEYLPNEEWIEKKENLTFFGITPGAIEQMGEIVYIEYCCEANEKVEKDDDIAIIESVKSVEMLKAPFDCILLENNDDLENNLDLLNTNSEGDDSWLVKLEEI